MTKILSLVCSFVIVFFTACDSNPGKTTQERIDYLVQKAYQDKKFVGNVLVADQGKVIYRKSFGNDGLDGKNNDSTKFLVASISKPITALVVLRLAERGRLTLNDTIDKYFKIADAKVGKVTIHQLLTHSSGIAEFIGKEANPDFEKAVFNAVLKFKPGADFEYCNSGYVLLMKIAEKVTGKKIDEIVSEEVFRPANMTRSGVARNSKQQSVATGYADASQTSVAKMDFPLENVDGAGSLYATTEDLYKLATALYGGKLLSEKTKKLMLTQHIPEKYGYGWFIRERGGQWDVYWAKGDLPGVTTFMSHNVSRKQTIILLANAANLEVADLENDIARVLKSKK